MEHLHATLAAFVERAVNLRLGADPEMAQGTTRELAALEGVVIGLEITTFPLELFFTPRAGKIRVAAGVHEFAGAREPQVRIRGGLFDLARLSRGDQAPGAGARLTIEGDVAAGHAFQRILKTAEFDWEELLARRLGDVAANELARGVRAAGRLAAQSLDSLNAACGEYLREEAKLVPGERELRGFAREVDELRDRVEALEVLLTRRADGAARG